ncbi:cytochrome P450 [Halorussus caseinilyticus]|uniref:Cytochrome P450 n=1 Tax=Halorussus caseinilyticus TaxID=3034025 RepID=A0ABD5WR46_9EURY
MSGRSPSTSKPHSETRTEWAKEGDVVRITGPEKDHYMVSHPDFVEGVLIKNNEDYYKFDPYKQIFGGGVVAVEGEQWRAQRGELQPFFRASQVRSYCDSISEIVTEIADGLTDGETFDAHEVMTDVTLRVMLRALFGEMEEDRAITEATDTITHWFRESASAGEIPENVEKEYESGRKQLVNRVEEMIEDRKQNGSGDDLLSTLVTVGSDSEADYTDERVRDEMITFLFGGHETSAILLTYVLYFVANKPKVEERLVAEIDEVLNGDDPRARHLDDLTYTEQVIDETMRYCPPAHAIFRETATDTTLGDYLIPEGNVVQLPEWVIHRDERWWDAPDEFRPSRFAGSSDRHSFAYFPFGSGPRQCIGEQFTERKLKWRSPRFSTGSRSTAKRSSSTCIPVSLPPPTDQSI